MLNRAALPALLVVFPIAESAPAAEALRGIESPLSSLPEWAVTESNVPALAVVSAVLFAAIAVVLLLAARRRWSHRIARLEAELAGAQAKLDRAALALQDDRQIVISWERPDA